MSTILITPHFTLSEFGQPCRHGLPAIPYPEKWIESRLRPLCEQLEIIRGIFDAPIKILSGYRSEAYNRKIGGAKSSQHVQGRAADIKAEGGTSAHELHRAILQYHGDGYVKLGGLGLYPGFVHVDVRPGPRLARWSGSRSDSA